MKKLGYFFVFIGVLLVALGATKENDVMEENPMKLEATHEKALEYTTLELLSSYELK